MEPSKVEPTVGAPGEQPLDPDVQLDTIGQVESPAGNGKRSWEAVGSALAKNRGALIIIGMAGLAVVGFVVQQQRNKQVEATSNTQVSIIQPRDAKRDSADPRVSSLDASVEQQALTKAREVGGSYIPPLATEIPPSLPKLAETKPSAQAPAPNLPPVGGQSKQGIDQQRQAEAEAERRRVEAIEKAMANQLGFVTNQVYHKGEKITPGVSNSKTADAYAAQTSVGNNEIEEVRLGYPMGTIWQATLITGADTDRPGTVRARIDEGPFAGRETLCNFDWASREYLNIECFAVKLDKESLPMKMVAVDADTMPNLKADYEGRYIKRLGSQFLAAFPAAYAQGMTRGGTTTQNFGGTTTTQKELNGSDLAVYAAGRATQPLLKEAQQIASEIRPRASVPPNQSIGLMLAEDI